MNEPETNRAVFVRRSSPGGSPWPLLVRIRALAWEITWAVLCRWTPKPANAWRLIVLRAFGTGISGRPFVHQRARITMPWHVELHGGSCLGDGTHLYALDRIVICSGALVAQEAYLCCGTHDLEASEWPLITAPIHVGERAFIGARAFVMPGISIGARARIGAMSVVTSNVPPGITVAGNPARPLVKRDKGS